LDRVDEVAPNHSVSEPHVDPPANMPGEPLSSAADVTGDSAAKPRRGRARARKLARSATAPVPEPPPVTWIQVGPGRFVRLEGPVQVSDQTKTAEATGGVSPEADTPVDVAPAAPAPAQVLAGQDPPTPMETSPEDVALVLASDDCSEGSSTEEYGIAPSAFCAAPAVSNSVERQDVAPGPVAELGADHGPRVTRSEQSLRRLVDSRRIWSQQATRRTWSRRAKRGMVPPVPAWGQASRRCDLRSRAGATPMGWLRFAPNVRKHEAARRAFGRVIHVQRALRPRSPPLSQRVRTGQALPAPCVVRDLTKV
jgi:hypothetical protein